MSLAPLIAIAAIMISIISYIVGVNQLLSDADRPESSLPPLMILAPLILVVGLGLAVGGQVSNGRDLFGSCGWKPCRLASL